ncbi:MAG: putative tellurite resistance protein B-like protein, partial [Rhodothermales bacterium]
CHCPSCGAPETLDNSDVCAYCDSHLNDGAHGWVLDKIEPYYGRRKRQVNTVPRQSLAKATAADEEVVCCAITLMHADGVVDEREEKQLHKFAKSRNIPPARLQTMINTVLANEGATIPSPSNTDNYDDLIGDLVRICLADGVVDESELAMLRMLGERINYSDYELDQLIKRERGEMYREARDSSFGRVVV